MTNNIIIFIIRKMEWLTGGDRGISVTPAEIFGIPVETEQAKYLLVMPLTAIFVLFAQNLFRTRIGRAFIAIREHDYSAEILGISLLRYKLTAFALGSAYAGAAGCLWTYFFIALTPSQFDLSLSILFLAALIVGGMGTVLGPLFGAAFVVLVPELLRSLTGLVLPYYPLALKATKQMIKKGQDALSLEEAYQKNYPEYDLMLASKDAIEGRRAFIEKRKPVWQGK